MSKYNLVLNHHDARTAIANELAEANRLKRLELWQGAEKIYESSTGEIIFYPNKKELEDQA